MTFTEAALEILKREGKPLHFKELTERAMTKKLLTFVGRTPEVTMQTQLTAAVKKAPGNPFVRVKPGIFGLLRYPEMPPEEREAPASPPAIGKADAELKSERGRGGEDKRRGAADKRASEEGGVDERGRRRRRRGGRGRGGAKDAEPGAPAAAGATDGESESLVGREGVEASDKHLDEPDDEPRSATGGLSAEARAAALAETGVLEGDDDDMAAGDDDGDDDSEQDPDAEMSAGGASSRQLSGAPEEGRSQGRADSRSDSRSDNRGEGSDEASAASQGLPGLDAAGDDDDDEPFGAPEGGDGAKAAEGDDPARRRRRRRRRRRGGVGGEGDFANGNEGADGARTTEGTASGGPTGDGAGASANSAAPSSSDDNTDGGTAGQGGDSVTSGDSANGPGQGARKIMAPADAAVEVLRGQPPGRGVHVRQLADSAIRRRLIHGEPNEAWRVIRTSLAAEPKERMRNGLRPRVRAAGSGLYALARRTPDAELEKAEQVFGDARRALRERTVAALEKRIAELPSGAFEALARVLLQREGFGPTTFVKRVEGTIYVEALRGRGSRPSKCLIALRPGGSAAGRRAIGELRAGVRARSQDEGLLMLGGRLAEDAISEWKQPGCPLEIADGAALAETCARHGVGVLSANVNVDFVDADFFAELAEG